METSVQIANGHVVRIRVVHTATAICMSLFDWLGEHLPLTIATLSPCERDALVSALTSPPPVPPPGTHVVNSAFTEKVKAGLFAAADRATDGYYDADDRRQEALCQTWRFYEHHCALGREPEDAALVYIYRRRARSRSDRFVPRARRRAVDVFDAIIRDHGVRLMRDDDVVARIREETEASVEASIDAKRFIAALSEENRAFVLGRLAGETTRELAARLGSSSATMTRKETAIRKRLVAAHHG